MSETKAIPMLLWCPECIARHIDAGEFATKPHHTHACQSCGHVWRPAIEPTCGVQFLPGFKNEKSGPPPVNATCEVAVLCGYVPSCPRRESGPSMDWSHTHPCGEIVGLNGCPEHPTVAATPEPLSPIRAAVDEVERTSPICAGHETKRARMPQYWPATSRHGSVGLVRRRVS